MLSGHLIDSFNCIYLPKSTMQPYSFNQVNFLGENIVTWYILADCRISIL